MAVMSTGRDNKGLAILSARGRDSAEAHTEGQEGCDTEAERDDELDLDVRLSRFHVVVAGTVFVLGLSKDGAHDDEEPRAASDELWQLVIAAEVARRETTELPHRDGASTQ